MPNGGERVSYLARTGPAPIIRPYGVPVPGDTTPPTRAAIYCRISLDRSGEGLGVGRQLTECRELAERRGWGVVEPAYQDNDQSAYQRTRPRQDFERLLRDIEDGSVDGLIAWHLDRLLRRVSDLQRLLDLIARRPGFPVAFVSSGDLDLSTPSGILLANILASVAQNESQHKAARVAAARKQEAHSGRAHTALGYGYNPDGTINPGEAEVVKRVATWLLEDRLSLLGCARQLNADEVPTPSAGVWSSRHVEKMLRLNAIPAPTLRLIDALMNEEPLNPAAAARLIRQAGGSRPDGSSWTAAALRADSTLAAVLALDKGATESDAARFLNGVNVPTGPMHWRAANLRSMIRRGTLCGWREYSPGKRGGYGELVAKGTWTPILTKEQTEAIRAITDAGAAPARGGRAPKHLLSTIAACGRCGAPLSGHIDRTGTLKYQCASQPGLPDRCGKLSIVGEPVDALISQAVIDVLADADVRTRRRSGRSRLSASVQEAEAELATVRQARERYARQAAAGDLTDEEWAIVREGLTARQRAAERVLGAQAPSVQHALRGVPVRRPEIEAWWEDASLDRRREVIKALIVRVVIAPGQRGGNRFDPSRVALPEWRI